MDYYKDIDELPIWNYYKILSTGQLKYLIIKGSPSKILLNEAWKNIEAEVINLFLKEPKFIEDLNKKKHLALLEAQYALNPTAYDKLILEEERKQAATATKGFDFYKTKAFLERELKFVIDEKKMSVHSFYMQLKLSNNGRA